MKLICGAIALGIALCALSVGADAQQAEPPIRYIIVDSSGSMDGAADGRKKIDVARDIVRSEMDSLAPNQSVALLTFGADKTKSCKSVDMLVSVGDRVRNQAGVEDALSKLTPGGSTPIAASLERAVEELDGRPGEIVLVTDGVDSCNRNVCALVRGWREHGLKVNIRVPGAIMDAVTTDELSCLASAQVVDSENSSKNSDAHPRKQVVARGDARKLPFAFAGAALGLVLLGLILVWLVRAVQHAPSVTDSSGAEDIESEREPDLEGRQLARWVAALTAVEVALVLGLGILLPQESFWAAELSWAFANTEFGSSLVPAALLGFFGFILLETWKGWQKKIEINRSKAERLREMRRKDRDDDAKTTDVVLKTVANLDADPKDVELENGELTAISFAEMAKYIDRIKVAIDERVDRLDGRRKRKYADIPRYDYRPIVLLLERDKELNDDQSEQLVSVLTAWRPYQTRRKPVPGVIANRIRTPDLSWLVGDEQRILGGG